MKRRGPVQATEEFLQALVDSDYVQAGQLSQSSWAYEVADAAADRIRQVYHGLGITAFSIEGKPVECSAVMVDVPVALQTQAMGVVDCLARVICEKGPYNPSRRGTWGVNPKSLLLQRTANAEG